MKRLICLIVFIIFSFSVLFAIDSVCISPYDENLANIISEGLGLKINKAKTDYEKQYLISGDSRFMEMLLSDSGAQALLVPEITNKDGLYIFKLMCYLPEDGNCKTIYIYLSQTESEFPVEVLIPVVENLTASPKGLVKLNNFRSGSNVTSDGKNIKIFRDYLLLEPGSHNIRISAYGYKDVNTTLNIEPYEVFVMDASMDEAVYNNLKITSDIKASVIKDSLVLGDTPFILDSYSVPLVVRLSADGYADTLVNISQPKDLINVKLKPEWMTSGSVYTEARDEFYKSFARSIFIFGAKVIFKSLEKSYSDVSKIGVASAEALFTISIADLIYDLFNYCRYAEYISP